MESNAWLSSIMTGIIYVRQGEMMREVISPTDEGNHVIVLEDDISYIFEHNEHDYILDRQR